MFVKDKSLLLTPAVQPVVYQQDLAFPFKENR